MTIPDPEATLATEAADRARFRRTLARVMAMQVFSLLLLWWLQATFAS